MWLLALCFPFATVVGFRAVSTMPSIPSTHIRSHTEQLGKAPCCWEIGLQTSQLSKLLSQWILDKLRLSSLLHKGEILPLQIDRQVRIHWGLQTKLSRTVTRTMICQTTQASMNTCSTQENVVSSEGTQSGVKKGGRKRPFKVIQLPPSPKETLKPQKELEISATLIQTGA